jgi:hypothetical protein
VQYAKKNDLRTLSALTLLLVGTTIGFSSGCDDDGDSSNTTDAATTSDDGSASGGTSGTGIALDGGSSVDSGMGGAGGAGTDGSTATGGSAGTGGAVGTGGTPAKCTPGAQNITVKYAVKEASGGLNINAQTYDGVYGGVAAYTAGNKNFQLQLQSGVTTTPCSSISATFVADAAPVTGKVYEAPASAVVLIFKESSNCSIDLKKLNGWNCVGGKVTITKYEGKTLEAKIEGNCNQPLPAGVVSGQAVGTFKLEAEMKTTCFIAD